MNADTRLMGMVISGISEARTRPRNRKVIKATSMTASAIVVNTARIERSIKIVES